MKVYYFAHMITQFAQIIPIRDRIGGKLIITHPFYSQYLKALIKYGLLSSKFIVKESNIPKRINGIFISQIPRIPFESEANDLIKIYIGHGVSDKKFSATLDVFRSSSYDYYFLSGNKDLSRLEQIVDDITELKKRVIKIGLLRGDSILKPVDASKLRKKYGILNDKKTVLYAPTWKFGGGTIRKCFYDFSKTIGREYNLIIRPHYFDHRLYKKHTDFIKTERLSDVKYITKPDLDITELFHISDILIADNSSIDYEYLLTGKPIVRINIGREHYIQQKPEYDLNRIAFKYKPDSDNILDIIEKAFSEADSFRKKAKIMADSCFYYNDGRAVERACSIIKALSENNSGYLEDFKLNN